VRLLVVSVSLVIVALLGAVRAGADIGVQSLRPERVVSGERVVVRVGSGLKMWERLPLYLVPREQMPLPAGCGAHAICEPRLSRPPAETPYVRVATLSFRRARNTALSFRVPRLAAGRYSLVIYCGPCYGGAGGSLITNTRVTLTVTAGSRRAFFHPGLSLQLPARWHIVRPRPLEPCTNPIPRLAVQHGRDLLLIEESLDPSRYIARFSARPSHFAVKGPPSYLACCAAAGAGRGWQLDFRDRGRGFYAYIYGNPQRVLPVLQTLRLEQRR
jgi:hypothetical protein